MYIRYWLRLMLSRVVQWFLPETDCALLATAIDSRCINQRVRDADSFRFWWRWYGRKFLLSIVASRVPPPVPNVDAHLHAGGRVDRPAALTSAKRAVLIISLCVDDFSAAAWRRPRLCRRHCRPSPRTCTGPASATCRHSAARVWMRYEFAKISRDLRMGGWPGI